MAAKNRIEDSFLVVQWKLLNIITFGPRKTDKITYPNDFNIWLF
jgi:hypothetical protein